MECTPSNKNNFILLVIVQCLLGIRLIEMLCLPHWACDNINMSRCIWAPNYGKYLQKSLLFNFCLPSKSKCDLLNDVYEILLANNWIFIFISCSSVRMGELLCYFLSFTILLSLLIISLFYSCCAHFNFWKIEHVPTEVIYLLTSTQRKYLTSRNISLEIIYDVSIFKQFHLL